VLEKLIKGLKMGWVLRGVTEKDRMSIHPALIVTPSGKKEKGLSISIVP
jgi:hypothetical protein